MSAPIQPGCESFSFVGGPLGVLVLHGFTGNPQSMRGLADCFAKAGLSVEMPLLPGHGTSVEDMIPTRFADWSRAADQAFESLAARCNQVAVVGLSMGGALTCWLAERHPAILGIVLVNPLVEPVGDEMTVGLQELLDSGVVTIDSIGSDIANPEVKEHSYEATPVASLISLLEGVKEVSANLSAIHCPVLLFSSMQDHVVPVSNGPHLIEHVSGSVEQIKLEQSFHVATVDFDGVFIEEKALSFIEGLINE